MKITVYNKDYDFRIDNFFGPAYIYQSREGDAIQLNGDILAPFKMIYGALHLCNDDFKYTFKEFLSGVSDSCVEESVKYVTDRFQYLFTDKDQENQKEEKETEQGED